MTEPNPFIVYSISGYSPVAFKKCTLRVLVSEAELHAAVYDPIANCFPRIERFSLQSGYTGLKTWQLAARIIQYASLFRQPFDQIEWIWNLQPYTLVPNELFDEGHKERYMEFVSPSVNGCSIQSQSICSGAIRLIFSVNNEWKTILDECALKPDVETHYTSWLMVYAEMHIKNSNGVLVHFHDTYIDVIIYRKNALQMLNTFRYQTTDECLYFVLLACEQFQFDRTNDKLHICGEIDSGSALFSTISKYFGNVCFLNRNAEPATGEPVEEAPAMALHYHMNLLHPAL
jgi:hypothetical protein